VAIARRQSRLELHHLAAEILAIVVERRRPFWIERDRLDDLIVDP